MAVLSRAGLSMFVMDATLSSCGGGRRRSTVISKLLVDPMHNSGIFLRLSDHFLCGALFPGSFVL